MAIIVEDGTGKSDAETYFDRDFFNSFNISWGLGDPTNAPDVDAEAAMRRGTLLFDAVYGPRFLGTPVNIGQALIFPLTGLIDRRNFELPVLPIQVQQAAAIISLHELNSPMSLFPTVTPGKVKKSITADKISVAYDVTNGGTGYISGARPILSIVESILSSIAGELNEGRAYFGRVERG